METKRSAQTDLADGILLFMTGAVLGWVYEVALHLVRDGSFVNRGMLHGPWLPIYGFGCVAIAALKALTGRRPLGFFLAGTAACGLIEYAGSWLLEALYHTRWWDYSVFPLNLHGRVFLAGLLAFGAAGTLFAYTALPALDRGCRKLPARLRRWAALLLLGLVAADALLSLVSPNMGLGITCG